ncbi:MAG: hypothetical protein AB9834_11750 [Lentimicrobium sp.]
METKINIYRNFSLLAMVACLPLLLASQTYSEKREESKTYRLKPGTLVQISNKYGNVNVMNWDKDSVRFEVSVSVQSKQPAKLNKVLSSIDCEMVSTASVISARTIFHDNGATFWKDVVSYAGQVVNTSNNLQIHYTVYMPENNPVKVENKFGNIYLDSRKGKTDITLSNGDLQARDFTGVLKLILEFGSASIQEAGEAQININYSDLYMQNVNKLNLISRSSTIDLDKVGSMEMESVRDKMKVESCTSVSGDVSFSRTRINQLGTVCSLTTKYGELKINGISREFVNIFIKSEYTDVLLGINPMASYSLDMIYDTKTILNIPPAVDNQLKKETINAKYSTIKANGLIGKSDASQITFTAKSGSFAIMNK